MNIKKITILIVGILVLSGLGVAAINTNKATITNNPATMDNNPPYEPSNPIPPDGATNVSEGNICWTGGDPDGDPVTYDVYLGNISPPPKISFNQASNCIDPGFLKLNTTYYWKIVAWDIYGASTEGPIWSFTTRDNNPPYEPSDPHPPDDGTNVPVNITLCWEGDDSNPGDIVTYDVYLGVNCPPHKVSNNQSENCYKPIGLELNKTYFWKIVTWDSQKLRAEGDVWSFHTGINHPPSAPIITNENIRIRSRPSRPAPIPGPHNYTFEATDPDGHDVYYWIEWGDDTHEGWIGPYASGEEITVEHTWDWIGTYNIRAKAKDIYDAESDWGYMEVIIPKAKQIINLPFLQFLERFPRMFPIIRQLIGLL